MESCLQDCLYSAKQALNIEKPSYRKKPRPCSDKDIVHELAVELWNADTKFGRAGKYINHP